MVSIFDRAEFTRTLFFPRDEETPPPAGARDEFVDVPGARLHVRLYGPGDPARTLLLFHGNGEVVADYDDSAEQFAAAGVRLAVADYRGYGQSTGEPNLRNLIPDARAIADAVQPAIAMGRSLGGAAAHELYARPSPGLAAVVLESAFCDLRGLIRRRGLSVPAALPADDIAMFDPATKLRAGSLPLLVLHGERDNLVSPDDARLALGAAGGTDKQLVFVPGRGHNDISTSPVYWDALAGFVQRVSFRTTSPR